MLVELSNKKAGVPVPWLGVLVAIVISASTAVSTDGAECERDSWPRRHGNVERGQANGAERERQSARALRATRDSGRRALGDGSIPKQGASVGQSAAAAAVVLTIFAGRVYPVLFVQQLRERLPAGHVTVTGRAGSSSSSLSLDGALLCDL